MNTLQNLCLDRAPAGRLPANRAPPPIADRLAHFLY